MIANDVVVRLARIPSYRLARPQNRFPQRRKAAKKVRGNLCAEGAIQSPNRRFTPEGGSFFLCVFAGNKYESSATPSPKEQPSILVRLRALGALVVKLTRHRPQARAKGHAGHARKFT
jgi:hypothetical protein